MPSFTIVFVLAAIRFFGDSENLTRYEILIENKTSTNLVSGIL